MRPLGAVGCFIRLCRSGLEAPARFRSMFSRRSLATGGPESTLFRPACSPEPMGRLIGPLPRPLSVARDPAAVFGPSLMRTIRRSASPLDHLSEAARAFFARRALELIGLGLAALAGGLTAALATWSVADPSLNHATDAPVRNLLGWPGAIAADLAMQMLGLGSLALIAPLSLWGWRLLRRHDLGRLPLRLALWIVGTGAAPAGGGALPPTARWPLPTGLGGVTGDALLRAAKAVTGLSGGAGSALLAFAFAGVAILATPPACGFAFADEAAAGASPPRCAGRPPDREDSEDALRDDEPGWGIVSLG